MLKKSIFGIVFMALLSLMAFANPANAERYNGACGGGSTLADVIAGAKAKGVLDDMARKTGQTPGVDGSAAKIVRDNYVRVIVTRGVWVTNYDCVGGDFVKLDKPKYLPPGTVLWMPEKDAPESGYTATIQDAIQENCGNQATGNIKVKRPGKKKVAKKPSIGLIKKLKGGSYTGYFTFKVKIGSAKTKTIRVKADQRKSLGKVKRGTRVKVTEINIPKGWEVEGSATQSYTIKSNRTITFTNVKQSAPTPAPAPAPVPAIQPQQPAPQVPQTPTTPQKPLAPVAEMPIGAHTQIRGNFTIFAKVKPTPGQNVALTGYAASDGTLSNPAPSPIWYDKTPCPTDWRCFTLRYQAPDYPVDQVGLAVEFTQDDQQWVIAYGQLKVEDDKDDWDN